MEGCVEDIIPPSYITWIFTFSHSLLKGKITHIGFPCLSLHNTQNPISNSNFKHKNLITFTINLIEWLAGDHILASTFMFACMVYIML